MDLFFTVRSAYLRKLGSILALCAILLTVLGPVVSQLRMRDSVDLALDSFCSATSLAQDSASQDHGTAPLHHGDACGYCSFAAHFPGMATVALAPALAPAASFLLPVFRRVSAPQAERRTWAQPRAPPVLAI